MDEPDTPERRGRLSRPRVLAAAVALVDREGLTALTMRRLATDLGVEPMAIYRYTSSKEALLDGLVEAFFSEVNDRLRTTADTDAGPSRDPVGAPVGILPWRAELRRIARAFAAVVHAHREILPVVATRPLAVPVARRPAPALQLTEHILAVLGRAGFDDATALTIYRAFVAWNLGRLLVDKRQVVDDPDEPDLLLRLGLHRLPAAEYPRLRALVPKFAEYDEEQELIAGLDSLLNRMPEPPLDSFYDGSAR
ncbi:TetR/AcrR family transcriptional regulator C-terminal domain-containing protein [Streptomyces flavotricini]|uniref:TetR/AcrR family transcriptional regulator C-terminal domain-containing protein n=1 Tax=Streptomyces flavotricini TaxID=66888 RepID=A0ABS8DXR2_9ACTN|nr:TetR/AcrR family transcriptional regulator C-terminal domain-containing protein [Streptomyces flavotricini]MCC0093565.1 TetR/AcrR family transcriptional regulator C-terminal domain-containing protein [Streptomyces flavotricini]